MTTPGSAPTSPRAIVAVIGMHRSGTSLTMQALGALGAQSGGGLLAGDDFNRNGYWEAGEVVAFHDRLLEGMGRRWGVPEHLLPLPANWWDSAAADAAHIEVRALLAARLALIEPGGILALKDPRMTLFLPLWTQAAAALGLELRMILCLRHPGEVAASLARRDRLDPAMGQALWLAYTLAAIEQAEGQDGAAVPMHVSRLDEWYANPTGSLARIADFAGLPTEGVVQPFVPDLATQLSEATIGDPLVASWWHELVVLPPGRALAPGMVARARLLRQGAGQGAVLAAAIRAEVGETPAHVLLRDLEAYRGGVDVLQDAYRQESEARAAYEAQARRFEDAYTHAQRRLDRLNPLKWFQKK